jgi:hypothetical protein
MTHTYKNDCSTFDITTSDGMKITIHLSDSPKSSTIDEFSRFMKDKGVTDVFCFCKPDYDPIFITNYGLNYHDLNFADGSTPSCVLLAQFDAKLDHLMQICCPFTTKMIIMLMMSSVPSLTSTASLVSVVPRLLLRTSWYLDVGLREAIRSNILENGGNDR